MQKNRDKLELSDIGYCGKPTNMLTKKELQQAFLEVVQQLYNCASNNKNRKDLTPEIQISSDKFK